MKNFSKIIARTIAAIMIILAFVSLITWNTIVIILFFLSVCYLAGYCVIVVSSDNDEF